MTICYKMGNVPSTDNAQDPSPISPNQTKSPPQPSLYPRADPIDHDYEIIMPIRPAPMPPAVPSRPAPIPNPAAISCNTLGPYAALEGVPFILNSRLTGTADNRQGNALPSIRARTLAQLDRDYNYDFQTERHS